MISDCTYCGILELNGTGFFIDSAALLTLVLPAALCFALWRFFITNKVGPRAGITVLGLDESSFIYSEQGQYGFSRYLRLTYFVTSIFTFGIGLLTSEAFKYLSKTLL